MTTTTLVNPARGTGSGWGRLRTLLALIGRHRTLLAMAVVSGIIHQVLMLAAAGTGAWLVGRAVTGVPVGDLTGGLVILAALVVPQALTPWLESYTAHIAAFRVLADLRGQLYQAFERLAPGYLLERRSGDLSAAAVSDVEQLEVFFAHTLSPLVVAVTVPVAALTALLAFDWRLAAALAPVLIGLATVPSWLRRRAEVQGARVRAELAETNAEAVDTVQGLRELVAFGAGPRHQQALRARGRSLLRAKVAHGRRAGQEQAATDVLATVGLLAVLGCAAWLVRGDLLEPALFPAAVVLAAMTFTPVIAVTDVARDLNLVAAAADRVAVLIAEPARVTDRVNQPPRGPVEPRISHQDVRFRYAAGLPDAVAGATFEIAPGETVALVGHSGAGKSTCANLLLRLWDVTGGSIRVGGHDLRDFPQADLRHLITSVPQDVYLFNTSLADNIRLGRPDASDAEVREAARAALADEFITGLPDGYDTPAGELGARLSGGQRQRIAIARALLADAPILVLDEAVSNLDAESEHELAAAMAHARRGRTTLLIAHRLSTIRSADRIVVLDHGRVAECGTHTELLARDGAYARLLATQHTPAQHRATPHTST